MRAWLRPAISTRPAEISDCEVLSELHSAAFRRGWSGAEFEALLLQPGVHALLAHYRSALGWRTPAGFVLYRLVEDEAEIVSLGVSPDCRRRGVARLLMEEALRHLYREGATSIHLEVEDSNLAAIGLYRRMEFSQSGKRAGYYAEGRPSAGSALLMLRQLR